MNHEKFTKFRGNVVATQTRTPHPGWICLIAKELTFFVTTKSSQQCDTTGIVPCEWPQKLKAGIRTSWMIRSNDVGRKSRRDFRALWRLRFASHAEC